VVDSVNTVHPGIIFVTDPICSWCWGVADDIQAIRTQYAGLVEFDLLLEALTRRALDTLENMLGSFC